MALRSRPFDKETDVVVIQPNAVNKFDTPHASVHQDLVLYYNSCRYVCVRHTGNTRRDVLGSHRSVQYDYKTLSGVG